MFAKRSIGRKVFNDKRERRRKIEERLQQRSQSNDLQRKTERQTRDREGNVREGKKIERLGLRDEAHATTTTTKTARHFTTQTQDNTKNEAFPSERFSTQIWMKKPHYLEGKKGNNKLANLNPECKIKLTECGPEEYVLEDKRKGQIWREKARSDSEKSEIKMKP